MCGSVACGVCPSHPHATDQFRFGNFPACRPIALNPISPHPPLPMIVTLLVLYYVRPHLRRKTGRRKVMSISLIAVVLATSTGRLESADAYDRFSPAQSVVPTVPESQGNALDDPDASNLFGGEQKLREGTVIPPTVGRLVNLGRRWAFVPTGNSEHRPDPLTNREPSSPSLSPAHQSSGSSLVGLAGDQSLDADRNNATFIILCENQMLQRIVEAMRDDAINDHWEISGEILEFFDQNRLLIRTVQRANSD